VVTIFSIRDYNPKRPSSSLMTDLLLEPLLQLDNTSLSLALHAVATTVFTTAVATATTNPPHGGGTEARKAVAAVQKLRSTPHGGGRRGAPRSAPQWLVALHSGDQGSAVRPRIGSEIFTT
jgi:hypothetical protein